jgi:hypothetical protein
MCDRATSPDGHLGAAEQWTRKLPVKAPTTIEGHRCAELHRGRVWEAGRSAFWFA